MSDQREGVDPTQSVALRDALFESILREDVETFQAICSAHSQEIIRQFHEWRVVPEELRHDAESAQAWGFCLMTIAQAFEAGGYPHLLTSLVAPPDGNPIEEWMAAIGKAQRLSELGQYRESNEILLGTINEMQGAVGNAVDDIRPKALGQLGTNYFRLEDYDASRRYTEMALEHCDAAGDQEGVLVYTENLATTLTVDTNSPAARCRESIAKSQELADRHQFERSNVALAAALADVAAHPELARYRLKIHGLLGSNHYRLGSLELAAEYTRLAMDGCREANDSAGVRIYEENLRVIETAADGADEE